MPQYQLDKVCESIGLQFINQMEGQGWCFEGNTALAHRLGMVGLVKQFTMPWVKPVEVLKKKDIDSLNHYYTQDLSIKTGLRTLIMEGLFSKEEVPIGKGAA